MELKKYCIIDYETRSRADLKKVGGYEYSIDPTTSIICAAYKIGTRDELRAAPTYVWEPLRTSEPFPAVLRDALNSDVTFVAHNAFFEQVITQNVLPRHTYRLSSIPVDRWICTASLAATLALPRKLDEVGRAMGTVVKKDMQGHRVMLKCSKPRTPSKHDPSVWHEKPGDLAMVASYCSDDIEVETELFLKLPPLSPVERKLWELDQRMNMRGIRVDRSAVLGAISVVENALREYTAELARITGGEVRSPNQVGLIVKYLAEHYGYRIESMAAPVLREALKGDPPLPVRRILEIRQLAAKSSTKKVYAFERRTRSDGVARDILAYHAASTGRWAAVGVQVHNLPRGKTAVDESVFDAFQFCDTDTLHFAGEPLDVVSSALRGMIVPHEGYEFFAGDWSAIEARVCSWLAGDSHGIDEYATNAPVYRRLAARIYRISVDDVSAYQRQVGKVARLGLQYGMGWKKFIVTCKDSFGVEIDESTAQTAVEVFREVHHAIVTAWATTERAAIAAVQNPTRRYKINKCIWSMRKKFLTCELPSGRKLYFYNPEIRMKPTPWKELRPALYHYAVNGVTRKWGLEGTYGGRLMENISQAVARDIMADAMLRLEGTLYRPVFTVHDEIVAEAVQGAGDLDDFNTLLTQAPAWAGDLPLEVGSWRGDRYRKA